MSDCGCDKARRDLEEYLRNEVCSTEHADIRQSPEGLVVYGDDGVREDVELPRGEPRGWAELDELYQAVTAGTPVIHDGRWGLATQEVAVAILESARTRKEVFLRHQVPLPDREV